MDNQQYTDIRNIIRWSLKHGSNVHEVKAMLNNVIQDQSRKVELITFTTELAAEMGQKAMSIGWEEG